MGKVSRLYFAFSIFFLSFSSLYAEQTIGEAKTEIAKLKDQINKIMTRIDQLERKPLIQLQPVAKPKNNAAKIVVTGRLDRAILYANNGYNSATQHVDNGNANSIINATAIHKYDNKTNIGAEIEAKMRQNSSDSTDIKNSSDGSAFFGIRKLNVFIDSKTYGKLLLGRSSSASNMTMEDTDLSKTDGVACGASIFSMAGGTTFVNKNTKAKLYDSNLSANTPLKNLINSDGGKVNINAVFGGLDASGIDGMGYQDNAYYQTPEMRGFIIATSHAYASPRDGQGNDLWDIAIKHAAEWQKIKFATQLAFVKNNTVALTDGVNTGYNQVNGSSGMLLPSGLSTQIAGTFRQWKYSNARDAKHFGIKLGYQQQYWQAGVTALSIDYGHFKNFVIDATSPTTIHNQYVGQTHGIFLVQFLDRVASQVYLGWRHHKLTIKGSAVQAYNIDAVMGGMLVKF